MFSHRVRWEFPKKPGEEAKHFPTSFSIARVLDFQSFPCTLRANMTTLRLFLFLLFPAASYFPIRASDTNLFESKIEPVLVEHCYKCHSAQSEKLKGGLH